MLNLVNILNEAFNLNYIRELFMLHILNKNLVLMVQIDKYHHLYI